MKIIYIYHSCYAILTDDTTIIIDFYQDSNSDKNKGVVYSELLKRNTKLYVLSTHSHADHYNPEILEWRNQHPDTVYVFSKEIQTTLGVNEDFIHFIDKLEVYQDDRIKIKAFGSTDIGGSFFIQFKDKNIFHAGDLNNWHWNEDIESTPNEIVEAEEFYKKELKLVSDDIKHLDIAMFPIAPRLGTDFTKGAQQFLATIKTDIMVPMHFGENYSEIIVFKDLAKTFGCKYINWTDKNQSINI